MESSEDNQPSFWQRVGIVVQHIPGAALMFAVIPLMVLGYLGWYFFGAQHLDQSLYSLRKESLTVSEQPDWIRSDVLDEVFEAGKLERISLLDPGASAAIAHAFEAHNWVKSAPMVTKAAGGTVDVKLIYRKPAAMVYYAPDTGAAQESKLSGGFYPVDDEGVILPTQDFGQDHVWEHFMVFAQGARPAGDVGMSYGDNRIAEALELCEFLSNNRTELGLQEIWVDQDNQTVGDSPWIMTIVTKDKHRLLWGHSPSKEPVGEAKADAKLARMEDWLQKVREQGGRHDVDLRQVAPKNLPVSVKDGP